MAIKFEELIKKVPQHGPLRSGKNVAPKDRNIYENLAQLYRSLEKVQGEIGGKGKDPDLDKLMENVKGLTAAISTATGRKSAASQEVIDKAKEAYAKGEIDAGIVHMDAIVDDMEGVSEETKRTAKEQLQRVGAGLGLEGTFIDQQYRDDEAAVTNKIQNPAPDAPAVPANPAVDVIKQDADGFVPENTEKTALNLINSSKRAINNQLFLVAGPREKQKMVASILAARDAVDSDPGSAKKLGNVVPKGVFDLSYSKLMKNDVFKNFVAAMSAEQIQEAFKGRGHGGNFEKMFREHVKSLEELPEGLPERFMPTMAERTEILKNRINQKLAQGADPKSPEMRRLYAEIFATRLEADSGRNDKAALKRRIDGIEVHKWTNRLLNDTSFNQFIDEKGPEVAALAAKRGHGGAMEDMFRQYISDMDKLPEDISSRYMPSALQRTESLINKMKDRNFAHQPREYRKQIVTELFATRHAAGARRNQKNLLDTRVDRGDVREANEMFKKSKTYNAYVEAYMDTRQFKEAITSGHGGAAVSGFEHYVNGMETAPKDVPDRYVSAGLRDRTILYEMEHANDAKDPEQRNRELNDIMTQKTAEKSWTKGQLKRFAAEMMYVNQIRLESRGNEEIWGPKMEVNAKRDGIQEFLSDGAMEKMFMDKSADEMREMIAKGPTSLSSLFYATKMKMDLDAEADIGNLQIGDLEDEKNIGNERLSANSEL